MDPDEDYGPCCACFGAKNVCNIMFLDLQAPVAGTGWGCVVCHLPNNGAVAVICDDCLEFKADIQFIVNGYLLDKKRVKIEEVTGPFGHDMSYHGEVRMHEAAKLPDDIEGAEEWDDEFLENLL